MRVSSKTPVNDPVVNRILRLLEEQGKTQKDLVSYLGLGNGAFTRWRYNGVKSYMEHIEGIAAFLRVTPMYLLNGEEGAVTLESLNKTEIELIANFRRLDAERKELISKNAKLLATHCNER